MHQNLKDINQNFMFLGDLVEHSPIVQINTGIKNINLYVKFEFLKHVD